MKRILTALLALALLCGMWIPAQAVEPGGMDKVRAYSAGQFTDVQETDWFSRNVSSVYEYGIMRGVEENRFDPAGQVTIAQALVIGCQIHKAYAHTADSLEQGTPWYHVYFDYAKKYGLISYFMEENVANDPIERYGFAMILNAATPEDALPQINEIENGQLPDVSVLSYYAEDVYRLYQAGVLTGSDQYGSFAPWEYIRRDAAAAIVSRILEPGLRQKVSFDPVPAFVPVPMDRLENRKSLQMKATDQQFAEAYQAAVELVAPIARYAPQDQLEAVEYMLRTMFWANMEYSMDSAHYNDPYGFFVEGSVSCAGCTRATGLCLNILGISYEHVNENQYTHQWARVRLGNEYWICDAFGDYAGPEPAPYQHPYL